MAEQKKSSAIYNLAEYESVLNEYWNNGTHQFEVPTDIVEEARSESLAEQDHPNTAKYYLDTLDDGNQA